MLTRATIIASLFVALPGAAATAAEPEPWLTDLRFPVNMAWAPDGTLFYAEKELGNVRMVVDGQVAPDPVSHVDVTVTFEQGLLGLAVHPGWPDEPWLYLYYSDAADGINRLIRVRVENGREVGRETLLDGLPTASAYHNGGDLLFGPDGMLYVTVGDAHDSGRAQDPTDLGGKVLRLTPEGAIPDDNPIAGSRTYTLGHRNSFGICVDPSTGDLWQTENGEPTDEINELEPGDNYGWPIGQGVLEDDRYRDPVATMHEVAPTGCAIWRGSLYVGTYADGLVRRFSLDPPAEERTRVAAFDEPVLDLAVGPDDRLYVATGTGISRFGSSPVSAEPDEEASPGTDDGRGPATRDGMPAWVFVAIGVLVALTLAVTLRLAARRR